MFTNEKINSETRKALIELTSPILLALVLWKPYLFWGIYYTFRDTRTHTNTLF